MRIQKINKWTIIAFMIALFASSYVPAHATSETYARQTEKLTELVHALTNENIQVESWSLYARKNTKSLKSREDFYNQASDLKKTFSSFHWNSIHENDQHHLELSGNYSVEDVDLEVTLFAYPRKNAFQTYLIYGVQGKSWDAQNWQKLSPKVQDDLVKLFQNNGKIFVWASGTVNDKMDFVMREKVDEFLNHFKANAVEKTKEKTFVSVSAYTNQWKDFIQTNGQKMNLQVGLRQTGNQTTMTLGTPIITTEY